MEPREGHGTGWKSNEVRAIGKTKAACRVDRTRIQEAHEV